MNLHKLVKLILFICLVFLFACDKEDEWPELIVNVQLIDENEYTCDDHSGIAITLTRGQEEYKGVTDSKGDCVFPDFPFGIFNVRTEKEGFISQYIDPPLTNHENDSIDVHSYKMLEIPDIKITIDSIEISPDFDYTWRLFAYGKLFNAQVPPRMQYDGIVYFGDTENVSKDDYILYHYAAIIKHYIDGDNCQIWITRWIFDDLIPPGYDRLYLRFYPVPIYPEWLTVREEALGEPSEVYEWVVPN